MKTDFSNKFLKTKQLIYKIKKIKKDKKKIVLCHGCFDILHWGHAIHFNEAKKFGDILIVSITKDRYIKKGKNRPVFSHYERAYLLSNLSTIDFVTVNNSASSEDVIRIIKPDIYVKGKDYANNKNNYNKNFDKEKKLVEINGGKILFTKGKTTSSTLAFKKLYEKI